MEGTKDQGVDLKPDERVLMPWRRVELLRITINVSPPKWRFMSDETSSGCKRPTVAVSDVQGNNHWKVPLLDSQIIRNRPRTNLDRLLKSYEYHWSLWLEKKSTSGHKVDPAWQVQGFVFRTHTWGNHWRWKEGSLLFTTILRDSDLRNSVLLWLWWKKFIIVTISNNPTRQKDTLKVWFSMHGVCRTWHERSSDNS